MAQVTGQERKIRMLCRAMSPAVGVLLLNSVQHVTGLEKVEKVAVSQSRFG